MAPFLGVMAAEPVGDQRSVPSWPARTAETWCCGTWRRLPLFLPVAKPGARVWIGDVHALQGDGVVDQTAIETAAEDLEIRYDLHNQAALRAYSRDFHPLDRIGFAAGLDDALVTCLRELIHWLHLGRNTEPEAYALGSMAVSFRVTQYAHQTGSAYTSTPPKAVHAVVPKAVFPAELRDRVARWLRP